jgi:hypothetical protein
MMEVMGGWRMLHREELHNFYTSPNIIGVIKSRRMRQEGQVACVGEMRNRYKILVGKSKGKKPLGRPMHRKEDKVMSTFILQ